MIHRILARVTRRPGGTRSGKASLANRHVAETLLAIFCCACLVLAWLGGGPIAGAQAAEKPEKPNVLFIAVDDLNDWIGALGGNSQSQTPNIDRLAARGMLFTNAHCAAPACNPSRAALMTGIRPSTSGVYHNTQPWRPAMPDAVTLPQHFMQHGYLAAGSGKIYHGGYEDDASWNDYLSKGADPKPSQSVLKDPHSSAGGIVWGMLDCADEEMNDYKMVDYAIGQLKKKHDKPFFLACGLFRPHMPWQVPKKYYDMYPTQKIILPEVPDDDLDDVPAAGIKMARPTGDHADILRTDNWRYAVQAYLASVRFADAQIGRLLDALDASDYAQNTILVLWTDHGWHLGEKQHWRKFALWEEATRTPVIVVAAGVTQPGTRCDRPVSLLDLYPTLVDLCGLSPRDELEGVSLRPLLENPTADWSRPALTTHGRLNHALRSDRWRYIRYADGSEELYDHQQDPMEWTNLANDSNYSEVKSQLAKWLPKNNAPDQPAERGAGRNQTKKPAQKRRAEEPRAANSPLVPLGMAKIDITPDGPIRLCGYGGRSSESEGVTQRLWAKALAIGSDEQGPAVLITADLLAVPGYLSDQLAEHLSAKAGVDRAHLAVCATHTHTGPCLTGVARLLFRQELPAEQQSRIDGYTRQLSQKLQQVAVEALAARRPGRLAWTEGRATFAMNRRVVKDGAWSGFGVNPEGPVDHALPLLCVTDADGKLRGVLLSYACHCTTYGGNYNKVHGDWAGSAAEQIEAAHPGAIAMVAVGCGADANPEPRSDDGQADRHGKVVAVEVERLLGTSLRPLNGTPTCRFRRIDLPFGPLPTRKEWEQRAARAGRLGFYGQTVLKRIDRGEEIPSSLSYCLQSWTFGDELAMVFLAGEVVVDYSLRLKTELDARRLWVNAYSNDVPCYIASKRLIGEGGYEVDGSMEYYDRPTRLSLDAEDLIIEAVHELVPPQFKAQRP